MSPLALLGWGLATGAALGVVYDFLRPLRQRHHAPADLIFVLLMLCAWVQYSFGICLGRIRLVTTAAFLLGLWLWERTVSRPLRPVFFGFWRGIFRILGWITFPAVKIFEKIRKFGKKVFASLIVIEPPLFNITLPPVKVVAPIFQPPISPSIAVIVPLKEPLSALTVP